MKRRNVFAAVLTKQGEGDVMQYKEVELDEPGPNEVLVKVIASGLCHSDVHYARGLWTHPVPVILGHEASGVIEEVGAGVPKDRIGEKVILSFSPGCGICKYCAIGKEYICDSVVNSILNGIMFDGTCRFHMEGKDIYSLALVASWSQYTVVPSKGAVTIPPDVDIETAALIGCGVTAGIGSVINTAKVRPGDSVAVFGCGGNRDRAKRAKMGKIASNFADYVILTNDNPRAENPDAILDEIEKGFRRGFKTYKKIPDRFKAIEESLMDREPSDVVVIAGKGHEDCQIIGDKRFPFDDKKVAERILLWRSQRENVE